MRKLITLSTVNPKLTKSKIKWLRSEEMKSALESLGVNPGGLGHHDSYLWWEDDVEKVLPKLKETFLQFREAAKKPAEQEATPSVANTIADMDHRISLIVNDVMEDPIEKINQMHAGNQAIFKALTALAEATSKGLKEALKSIADLEKLVKQMSVAAPATAPVQAPAMVDAKVATKPEPKPKATPKKHMVGIIGVMPNMIPIVMKEFGEAFDLSLVKVGEPDRIPLMQKCDSVYALRGAVGSGYMLKLKTAGVQAKEIGNSLSKIRDTLTNLYVEVAEETK